MPAMIQTTGDFNAAFKQWLLKHELNRKIWFPITAIAKHNKGCIIVIIISWFKNNFDSVEIKQFQFKLHNNNKTE